MNENTKSIKLICGGPGQPTHKEYNVSLEAQGDGWVVNSSHGRVGGCLYPGTKTLSPVEHAEAVKIFDKLVRQKVAKGYGVVEESDGVTSIREIRTILNKDLKPSDMPVQLLNDIYIETLPDILVRWPYVMLQTKWDGERRPVRVTAEGVVIPGNRNGFITTVHPEVDQALRKLGKTIGDIELDTEDMGEYLVIFDCTRLITCLRNAPFEERAQKLHYIMDEIEHLGLQNTLRVNLPANVFTLLDLNNWLKQLELQQEEGAVFRNPHGTYVPGKPNSGGDCLRYKFTTTATVRVMSINKTRSVSMGVRNAIGDEVLVGNVTIPPNYDVPEVGDLIEVKYLHAFWGGCIYQPVYKGKREDKTEADFYTSLKFKKGTAPV